METIVCSIVSHVSDMIKSSTDKKTCKFQETFW